MEEIINSMPECLTRRELYFFLFDAYSDILAKENPCGWIGNTCVRNRENGTANGCCQKCPKNTTAGCSIQSLGCKAFLCEKAFNRLSETSRKKWRALTEIKEMYLDVKMREEFKPTCQSNFDYGKCNRIQMFGCKYCDLNPDKENWFER